MQPVAWEGSFAGSRAGLDKLEGWEGGYPVHGGNQILVSQPIVILSYYSLMQNIFSNYAVIKKKKLILVLPVVRDMKTSFNISNILWTTDNMKSCISKLPVRYSR